MGRKPITKQVKQSSFFKILLDDFAIHLCIPPKFAKNHIRPSQLGKCVLKGPCGNRTVEIQRRKNGLFFHNHGWRSFVKDNLLQRGDLLMFRYDGKSKFKVKIYDRTCCEIDVEAPKRKNGFPTIPSENGGQKISWVKDEMVDVDNDAENENGCIFGKNRKLGDGGKPSTRSVIFKSEYSCFKATISRYGRFRLVIPKELAKEKGLERKKSISVKDPNGKMWPAKIVMVDSSVGISTSWSQCRKANDIFVGDTVVFEFVEDGVMRLHVVKKGVGRRGGRDNISVVLDAPNVSNAENENGFISGKNRKLGNGKKPSTRPVVFKSENPCFLQIITKYTRYRVTIPKNLAVAKGLESKESIVVEDLNGKMWAVKIVMVYSSVAISTGWVECFKANKIKKGNIVVFEFVEDAVLRVHVVSRGVGKRGGHNRVVLDAPNIRK